MTIDLKAIRETAEAATQGEWSAKEDRYNGIHFVNAHETVCAFAYLSEKDQALDVHESYRNDKVNAAHIAMMDPPTTIALLDRLEAVERQASELRDVLDYLTQDQTNTNGVRMIDMGYSAFMMARQKNNEDGGPTDWMTDTRPIIWEAICKVREILLSISPPQALGDSNDNT